jgi:predicted phage tail protein
MVLPGLIHTQPTAPVATGCTEPVLREVVLHGALRREFGDRYEITANSPVLALNGLMTMLPGLYTRIAQGEFAIVVGKRRKTGRAVGDVADLAQGWQPGERTLHVVPVVKGRGGGGGTAKIIIGIAIIALAVVAPYAAFGFAGPIFSGAGTAGALSFGVFGGLGATAVGGITFGTLAGLGAIVALGGVAQMLSPQPKTTSGGREAPGENPSLVFNSVVNSVEEGNVVPLIYGDVLCGSQVIAAGITPEDVN